MIRVTKTHLTELNRCYSLAPLTFHGKSCFLAASEIEDRCLLFDEDLRQISTVWEKPGGVMSMSYIPGSDGEFLSVQQFYGPDHAEKTIIVRVTPNADGTWAVHPFLTLPFIHRFDIVSRNGFRYLIVCAIKSGQAYEGDWSVPGKTYAAILPEDLSTVDEAHPLQLTVIKDDMLKNHGYYKIQDNGTDKCIISCESGVYLFTPPENPSKKWEIECLIEDAASDATLVDLDGDGEKELCTIAPFHDQFIYIYKKINGKYERVYTCEKETPFVHAIYGGPFNGKPVFITSYRRNDRELLLFSYDQEKKQYTCDLIDPDTGSTNVLVMNLHGKDVLLSANCETHEVAAYQIEFK